MTVDLPSLHTNIIYYNQTLGVCADKVDRHRYHRYVIIRKSRDLVSLVSIPCDISARHVTNSTTFLIAHVVLEIQETSSIKGVSKAELIRKADDKLPIIFIPRVSIFKIAFFGHYKRVIVCNNSDFLLKARSQENVLGHHTSRSRHYLLPRYFSTFAHMSVFCEEIRNLYLIIF